MPYDPEQEENAGAMEASVTFTNAHGQSAKEFKDYIEEALSGQAFANLAGTIRILPNHDETGVIIGSG
jgi:hypothetical protein